MNFPSLARLLAHPAVLGLGGSGLLHGAVVGLMIYFLLALPQVWEINVRRGEAVVIQAQMAALATAMPEQVSEVEVSLEAIPLVPPPPAVDQSPVRETLEPVPVAIPLARQGEYEPTDVTEQKTPPETPQQIVSDTSSPSRREPTTETPPQPQQVAAKAPPRQVADQPVIAESNISVAAIAPAQEGAQVDEVPRKLPHNREPYYPLDALQSGREGRVVLRVQIAPTGRTLEIAIYTSSGTPSLDASAIDAVRDWEFTPAKSQGVAVLHEVLVPVNFRIRRG